MQVSLRYGDGSLGTITYVTEAHRRFPKETFEASSGGRTARLDNFKSATVWSGTHARVRRHLGATDKGQRGPDHSLCLLAAIWRPDAHLAGVPDRDHSCHPRRCRRSSTVEHLKIVTRPLSQRKDVRSLCDESGRTRMASPAALADVRHRGGLADLRPFEAQTMGEPADHARGSTPDLEPVTRPNKPRDLGVLSRCHLPGPSRPKRHCGPYPTKPARG